MMKGTMNLKSLILLFLIVVFLAYTLIWIMMPTNTFYLNWLQNIYEKTDSIYFGKQGADILIYIFPILFIATLSCLYLHIKNKLCDSNTKRAIVDERIALWKRTALIKGPLGIVSWTELSILAMFVALLVWSFGAYLHGMYVYSDHRAAQLRKPAWKLKIGNTALSSAFIGNISLVFLFFPVTRGSSILRLVGLTSESSIKYHIWLGHITMTLFTAHSLICLTFWAETGQLSEALKWDRVGISNVAGEISFLFGLLMWATSLPRIRRKIFELFFYTHHLYVLFLVFYVFHVGFSYSCMMLPGFYLFLVDRYLRYLQSQQRIRLLYARVLPCNIVELIFSKCPGLSYLPRSSIFLNIPEISRLQWHPFTITSSSNLDPTTLSVVIKTEGRWTRTLHDRLLFYPVIDRMDISLEGPYGPHSSEFLRHEMLVMVCGGSGITPFISIIRELIFRANSGTQKTPNVLLICAFKKTIDLAMLDLILPVLGTNCDVSQLPLRIEAYVTRDKQPSIENYMTTKPIWFKPNLLDVPVSAVLGQHNWLWLAMIISVSFVIFLLQIALLTRYFIYPVNHNSNMVYSFTLEATLIMLFMCISIAITASAAFLWNKKRRTNERKCFDETQVELESLPCQSVYQATNIHYGTRPDLKRILSECKDSSVGVFVSGPKKMRQQVATVCSGLANNLHFQSSSFSW